MVLDTGFMESVPLRLSPRLRLMPTCTEDMEDMDMDMVLAMPDIMVLDIMVLATGFMESVPLKLNLRLLPTPIFSMDVDMDTLDMLDTTDTHMVDMPTTDKPALP